MNKYTERNLTNERELFYQQIAYLSEGNIQMIDIPIGWHTKVNELMPPKLDSSQLVKSVATIEL